MKFWLIVGIPILSYLLLKKTFNLALYGDDWLQLYNLWLSFDVHKTLSFFDIKSYLSPYWPQYFFLGIIRHFFDYQAQAYFAASLILRVLATISLYFVSYEFSKSRLAAFLTSILFTFSVAGLQTTDWVFNMNTYAGIFFFNFALIMYLKIRNLKTFLSWRWLFFILFFFLALGVVPVRMHGALPFLIICEFFLFSKIDKFLVVRLLLPIIIMITLVKVGSFGGEGDTLPLLDTSFKYLREMLSAGRYDILFYFLGVIGNIAIPDIANLASTFGYLLPTIVFFSLIGLLICITLRGGKIMYLTVIIFNLLWAIIGSRLTFWNPNLPFSHVFSITAGFETVLLSLIFSFYSYESHPKLSGSLIIALIWITSFTLLYWLRSGYLIIESTGRYMTLGAAGFAILFGSLLTISFKNFVLYTGNSVGVRLVKSFLLMIPLLLLIGWLNINFQSINLYLASLETNRNLDLAGRTWTSLKKFVPTLDKDAPSVFYFTYDNPTTAYMVLTFGFWPHAGLVYGITNWENSPLPTDSYGELLEMVRTGEPLKRVHSRKQIPLPLTRVFAFDFRNGQLSPITDLIRNKLTEDLKKP